MEKKGWIKLHRRIIDWEWFGSPSTLSLWIHILFMANWEDKKWQGQTIKRGSFITSLQHLSQETGLSIQQTRSSLNNLEKTNEITRTSTNKYTVILVNKYDDYQVVDNKQITNEQQTNNKRTTTTKEYKEIKNINTNTELKEFLDLFNSLFGSKYTQTAGRGSKLSLRLKTYSFEQIKKSLENLSKSEWHQGKNDRGWKADPDFLLRSDEQIDKWLNYISDKKVIKKNVFFLQSELNEMTPAERKKAIESMKGNNL